MGYLPIIRLNYSNPLNYFNYFEYFSVKDEKIKAIVLYNRGTIRYRMGCFSDALGDLELALKSEPDNEEFKEAVMKCKNDPQK